MKLVSKAKRCSVYFISLFLLAIPSVYAENLEITPYVGQMFSSDLSDPVTGENINVDSATSIGLGFAWQDTPRGQGQILVNYVSHDFANVAGDENHSLDVLYAHFNGIALFKQRNYVTTFSIGLGGAYFDTEESDELYPSATIAMGTRYEFAQNLALVTEIRAYAALVDEEDQSFCKGDVCSAQFDGAVWTETLISVGLAYRF